MAGEAADTLLAPPELSEPSAAGSRRREVAAASARSLLLTVLGEFVYPRGEPVWTGVLVDALGLLGVEEKSARQALARTTGDGLLAPSRHGRRAQWSLTPLGTRILEEGTERIYGFMRSRRGWDGRWLVLTVAIPETQRKLRHRLRTRLTWAGLGSPAPGLWVVPDAEKEPEIAAVIADLGISAHAYAWVGPRATFSDERRLVSEAWCLGDVESRYSDFIADFSDAVPADGPDAFIQQVRLIQEWRRFPFLDPALPAELLDHEWPGAEAADIFHRQHDAWHTAAQEHWESLSTAR
jgi:phenylacetic acid degradation operon negative regulatory protein